MKNKRINRSAFSRQPQAVLTVEVGFYYYGMCIMEMLPNPDAVNGGDVMLTLWRRLDTPLVWTLTYRFRLNVDLSGDAWADDHKTYGHAEFKGTEQEAVETTTAMANDLRVKRREIGEPDWLIIQGDHDKFHEVTSNSSKSWISIRKMSDEAV